MLDVRVISSFLLQGIPGPKASRFTPFRGFGGRLNALCSLVFGHTFAHISFFFLRGPSRGALRGACALCVACCAARNRRQATNYIADTQEKIPCTYGLSYWFKIVKISCKLERADKVRGIPWPFQAIIGTRYDVSVVNSRAPGVWFVLVFVTINNDYACHPTTCSVVLKNDY